MGQGGSSCSASGGACQQHALPASPGHGDKMAGSRAHHSRDKKRMVGLATLRRRLLRRHRQPKALNHTKIIRDFTCDWSAADVRALCAEYAALSLLRQVWESAALARPAVSTCCQDLCQLYRSQHCADVQLLFQGRAFPVHRCILSARCAYFRQLLKEYPRCSSGQVPVCIGTAGVDVSLFDSLLQYLYCGQMFCQSAQRVAEYTVDQSGRRALSCRRRRVLAQLEAEFGAPGAFERDMKFLLESGEWADALLVFRPPGPQEGEPPTPADPALPPALPASVLSSGCCSGYRCAAVTHTPHTFELPCHRAVLSARSHFFRALIRRRCRPGSAAPGELVAPAPIRIELDDSVISRRYAYVLLRAMYMDTVDLALIMPAAAADSTAAAAASVSQLHLDDVIELYHIGRFLELPTLVHGSENLLVEALSLENVVRVLQWSEQSHGSQWVHRHALQLLCEEFGTVVASAQLLQLTQAQLLSLISCDFLQASELQVLQAIMRWSEHQLLKRLEDREPNLLSHTAHSVARKSVKLRELDDSELLQLAAPLLRQLRAAHLLPAEHMLVSEAVRRGLLAMPPSHMRHEDTSCRARSWLRCKHKRGEYVRPRLFQPYVDEMRAIAATVQHQGHGQCGGVCCASGRHLRPPLTPSSGLAVIGWRSSSEQLCQLSQRQPAPAACGQLCCHVTCQHSPMCSGSELMTALLLRRDALLQPGSVYQSALACRLLEPTEVLHLLNLQVVREMALPDSMARVLQEAAADHENQLQRLKDQRYSAAVGVEGRCRSASDLEQLDSSAAAAVAAAHFHTLDLDSPVLREANMPDIALTTNSSPASSATAHCSGTVPRRRHAPTHRRRRPDLGDRQHQSSASTELLQTTARGAL